MKRCLRERNPLSYRENYNQRRQRMQQAGDGKHGAVGDAGDQVAQAERDQAGA